MQCQFNKENYRYQGNISCKDGLDKGQKWYVDVTRVYVPWFFVSSQQRFGATDIKALGASQLSGLGQTMLQLRQISVTAPFYLEDSRRIHPRSGRACQPKDSKRREWRSVQGGRERQSEGEKERARMHVGERESEKALWLLFLYVFSSTWACPMQIGQSQECCLFCLKSSFWSSDLPLTFLVF